MRPIFITFLILILMLFGGHSTAKNQKTKYSASNLGIEPKKISERWFPEPNIEIRTPAFLKKNGFTTHQDLIAFLTEIQSNHPENVEITWIGESQKGKKIPLLKINSHQKNALKVWIQGGLHGDEPASTEGILYLIQNLFKNENQQLLNDFNWCFVPMANIDGYEKNDRYAANGLDLNRDQTKLLVQESVFLKKALCEFEPHLALDFHEYRPYRKDFLEMGNAGLGTAYDVMILNSNNLNIPKNQREFTQTHFVQPLFNQLIEQNFRPHTYFSTDTHLGELYLSQGSSNARSSATSFALTGAISTLFEIRGVGIGKTSFKRRVYSTYLCALSYLQSAHSFSNEIIQMLEQPTDSKQVVVDAKSPKFNQNILMVDLMTGDTSNIQLPTRDAKNLEAVLTRSFPEFYAVLPSETNIITRLNWFNLQCDTLKSDSTLQLETYISEKSCTVDAQKYEGVYRQKCTFRTDNQSVSLPKGSLIYRTQQRKGKILLELLEPDAPNSLFSYHIIEIPNNKPLPYYRKVKN